jgi:hypothetical protein
MASAKLKETEVKHPFEVVYAGVSKFIKTSIKILVNF